MGVSNMWQNKSNWEQHDGHVTRCRLIYRRGKAKESGAGAEDAAASSRLQCFICIRKLLGQPFTQPRTGKPSPELLKNLKRCGEGLRENWPRRGRCHSRQWWRYASRSSSPTGRPLTSAIKHTQRCFDAFWNTDLQHDVCVRACVGYH